MSSSGGRGWIIPGGKVDPLEADNPSISAIREAREEGGVVGETRFHSQHQHPSRLCFGLQGGLSLSDQPLIGPQPE